MVKYLRKISKTYTILSLSQPCVAITLKHGSNEYAPEFLWR